MHSLIRLLLSLELVATGCEQLLPVTQGFLPLGGSKLAELGLILILVVVQAELRAALDEARARRRERLKADHDPASAGGG